MIQTFGVNGRIKGILFDMGGTLRRTFEKSKGEKDEAIQKIIELIGADAKPAGFFNLLMKRAMAYKEWAEGTLVELKEPDLWTRWMLPDWPAEKIAPVAVQLNQMFRDALGERVLFPETYEVLHSLYRRGYHLGLVSNTTSSVEVPAVLREMQLTGCFDVVILSTVIGKRKPDPDILLHAAERMGLAPAQCVYVGDRPNRDVAAARKAGFSQAILIGKPGDPADDPSLCPDHRIDNLKDLLDIFPSHEPELPVNRYRASLSTMWSGKNFPNLLDFFEFSRRAGLESIELNHQIDSAMLAGIDLEQYSFSSIHEPCPADISLPTLMAQDWLISSLEEERRRKGVDAVKRSIDLAQKLGASTIVVHAGTTQMDRALEKGLRDLILAGKQDGEEYRSLHQQMIQIRAALAPAALEAVKQSLIELITFAEGSGIRLGLENRYHYREIPSPDELEGLLGLAGPERLGFIFDVGHAYHLSRLGFYPHDEWLRRFSKRIVETHLHDVRGIYDHFAPGTGEVDFDQIAAYLPETAIRTCEYHEMNSPEQVRASLQYLYDHGCIKTI